jgi:hypothetical protein
LGSHVFRRTAGGGTHARNKIKPGRRTDRASEAPLVDHPFAGEFVERRRAGELVAEGTKEGIIIFTDQAEDIGPIRLGGAEQYTAKNK